MLTNKENHMEEQIKALRLQRSESQLPYCVFERKNITELEQLLDTQALITQQAYSIPNAMDMLLHLAIKTYQCRDQWCQDPIASSKLLSLCVFGCAYIDYPRLQLVYARMLYESGRLGLLLHEHTHRMIRLLFSQIPETTRGVHILCHLFPSLFSSSQVELLFSALILEPEYAGYSVALAQTVAATYPAVFEYVVHALMQRSCSEVMLLRQSKNLPPDPDDPSTILVYLVAKSKHFMQRYLSRPTIVPSFHPSMLIRFDQSSLALMDEPKVLSDTSVFHPQKIRILQELRELQCKPDAFHEAWTLANAWFAEPPCEEDMPNRMLYQVYMAMRDAWTDSVPRTLFHHLTRTAHTKDRNIWHHSIARVTCHPCILSPGLNRHLSISTHHKYDKMKPGVAIPPEHLPMQTTLRERLHTCYPKPLSLVTNHPTTFAAPTDVLVKHRDGLLFGHYEQLAPYFAIHPHVPEVDLSTFAALPVYVLMQWIYAEGHLTLVRSDHCSVVPTTHVTLPASYQVLLDRSTMYDLLRLTHQHPVPTLHHYVERLLLQEQTDDAQTLYRVAHQVQSDILLHEAYLRALANRMHMCPLVLAAFEKVLFPDVPKEWVRQFCQ